MPTLISSVCLCNVVVTETASLLVTVMKRR